MTETTSKLLAEFDTLPPNEQHELLVAMLRRTGDLPDSVVSDKELVGLADVLFQELDAEESDGGDPDAR